MQDEREADVGQCGDGVDRRVDVNVRRQRVELGKSTDDHPGPCEVATLALFERGGEGRLGSSTADEGVDDVAAVLESVYRPLGLALAVGAAAALVVGWVRPAPWLLALLLLGILTVLWCFAVSRFLAVGERDDELSLPH